jgi:hypothetical protein
MADDTRRRVMVKLPAGLDTYLLTGFAAGGAKPLRFRLIDSSAANSLPGSFKS